MPAAVKVEFSPVPIPHPAAGSLDEAVAEIEAAALPDHREPERRRMLEFCRQHGAALHRTCEPGHLTGSGFVIDPRAGKVLLIHHQKLGRWLQPGGHADGDGRLSRVARREILEETGLEDVVLVGPAFDLDVHAIPARGPDPRHLHYDLRFLVVASSTTPVHPNGETRGARWLHRDDPLLEPGNGSDVAEPAQRALRLGVEHGLARLLAR